MDETTPDAAPVDALAPPPADEMPSGETTPTAQAAYDIAQGVEDLISQAEAMLEKGEHPKGKAKLRKLLDDLKSYAEDATAIGEMVEADVAGDEKSEPPADESAEPEPEPAPEPLEKSATGQLITKSGYKPRRWSYLPAAKPVAKSDPAPALTPDQQAALERRIRRLETAARKTR